VSEFDFGGGLIQTLMGMMI